MFSAQSMPEQGRRQEERVSGTPHHQEGGNACKQAVVDAVEGETERYVGDGSVGTRHEEQEPEKPEPE